MNLSRIILASASPRRRQLLEQVGLPFTVQPSQLPENLDPAAAAHQPAATVQRLALAKARWVWRKLGPTGGDIVLGADTAVFVPGQLLGKPADAAQARRMLRSLSGRTHTVHTGLALIAANGRELVSGAATRVMFRNLDEAFIAAYTATGEPLDKAGAYGIQGKGALLVAGLEGCYFNVVGLPLSLLADMLAAWRLDWYDSWAANRLGQTGTLS